MPVCTGIAQRLLAHIGDILRLGSAIHIEIVELVRRLEDLRGCGSAQHQRAVNVLRRFSTHGCRCGWSLCLLGLIPTRPVFAKLNRELWNWQTRTFNLKT